MNQSDKHKPNTVDEVVDEIIADLTLAEKGDIAFTGIDYCIISPYQAVIKLYSSFSLLAKLFTIARNILMV